MDSGIIYCTGAPIERRNLRALPVLALIDRRVSIGSSPSLKKRSERDGCS
jgi:hypothetical protein